MSAVDPFASLPDEVIAFIFGRSYLDRAESDSNTLINDVDTEWNRIVALQDELASLSVDEAAIELKAQQLGKDSEGYPDLTKCNVVAAHSVVSGPFSIPARWSFRQ